MIAPTVIAAVQVIHTRPIPATFGVAPDGRLFRSERGNPLLPFTWWQAWQKVWAASLGPEQLASPLMKRPYDLRRDLRIPRFGLFLPQVPRVAGATRAEGNQHAHSGASARV
jgi:hypothetical protein